MHLLQALHPYCPEFQPCERYILLHKQLISMELQKPDGAANLCNEKSTVLALMEATAARVTPWTCEQAVLGCITEAATVVEQDLET